MPTTAGLVEFYRQHAGQGLLTLLTLAAPNWAEPVRLVAADRPVISRGLTWTPWAFEVTLPDVGQEGVQPGRLIADATAREIVALLREQHEPITATIECVLEDAPDVVEVGPLDLAIQSISGSRTGAGETIEAPLVLADRLDERYPADVFTPTSFAGLVA